MGKKSFKFAQNHEYIFKKTIHSGVQITITNCCNLNVYLKINKYNNQAKIKNPLHTSSMGERSILRLKKLVTSHL